MLHFRLNAIPKIDLVYEHECCSFPMPILRNDTYSPNAGVLEFNLSISIGYIYKR